jgi:putative tricarboxylic transport membrane protein
MDPRQHGIAKMDLYIGLTIVALGAVLALGLQGIEFGAGYDRIGPRFFPYVVAFGLIVLGGWFVAAAFLRQAQPAQLPAATPVQWMPIAYLAVALALTLALMDRAGFVIACAIQFWLVARAFGSRRPVRDAIVACGLSVVCFVAFSSGLGLTLPSGILEGIL